MTVEPAAFTPSGHDAPDHKAKVDEVQRGFAPRSILLA
jgi:hypothetical protein